MAGNPYCWVAGFSYEICCQGFGAGGNPACWDGHFTYARCCVAPEEEALAQVAAAAAERARKVERVGLYKDYVPGKDCWTPPLSYELCCDLTQGPRGRAHCWDEWRLTFERCCFLGEELNQGRWQLPLPPKPDEIAEEEEEEAPSGPVGSQCWSNGYSFRACCRLGDEEEDFSEQRESCWDGLHTEERCCRGLVTPPTRWRPALAKGSKAQCLTAVLARPLRLTESPDHCPAGEHRYFYLAQLGKVRLRMDFDATAIPWFLEPQWNTSAWAQHVARYGPSGVHDHKVVGGLCVPLDCEMSTTAQFLAPRVAPWWRFPMLEPWPLNGSHVLLPPPLAIAHQLHPKEETGVTMWVSKSSCQSMAQPSFCEDYWQFALHERRLLSTPPLTPTRESMAVALGLAALAAVVAGVVVAEERDERARSCRSFRADLLRVLLTMTALWAHVFHHGSWQPVETPGLWFASQHLTYKVNVGFVVLSTHLRLSRPKTGRTLLGGAVQRYLQLALPLGLWTMIYLFVFVEGLPMNNLMKSSGLHRWYTEKRSECRRPAHLALSLLLLHEVVTGRNSPCHNSDIFESQFLLDLAVLLMASTCGTPRGARGTSLAWLLWLLAIVVRFRAISLEEHDWAFAYSHRFRMLLPSALATLGCGLRGGLTAPTPRGFASDFFGFCLVAGSCTQDLFLFGWHQQLLLKPLQRAVAFQVAELCFVLGLLLLLRPSPSSSSSSLRWMSKLSLGVNVSNLFVFHALGGYILEDPLPMSLTSVVLCFLLVYGVSAVLALMMLAVQRPVMLLLSPRVSVPCNGTGRRSWSKEKAISHLVWSR